MMDNYILLTPHDFYCQHAPYKIKSNKLKKDKDQIVLLARGKEGLGGGQSSGFMFNSEALTKSLEISIL